MEPKPATAAASAPMWLRSASVSMTMSSLRVLSCIKQQKPCSNNGGGKTADGARGGAAVGRRWVGCNIRKTRCRVIPIRPQTAAVPSPIRQFHPCQAPPPPTWNER